MNLYLWAACAGALAVGLTVTTPARAGDGHDHGPDAAATRSLPRVGAESEAFELVGVLEGKQMTIYLDRFADNSPVEGAQIALETGNLKLTATAGDNAIYLITFTEPLAVGDHPMTFTISAGKESDLLTGSLHLDAAVDARAANDQRALPWKQIGIGAAVALLLALIAALLITRRLKPNGETV